MSVRISATDWAGADGVTPDEAVLIAEAFAQAGADLIDVSAGQTWAAPSRSMAACSRPLSPTRSATRRRLATMAVGNITDPDQANAILLAGRADLVALGRPHLSTRAGRCAPRPPPAIATSSSPRPISTA
jgi:anthraniloyl-CoA monooxygenase